MSLLHVTDGVVVFSPDREEEARAFGVPMVAYMPVENEMVAEGAYDAVAVRADAYASDEATLAAAVACAAALGSRRRGGRVDVGRRRTPGAEWFERIRNKVQPRGRRGRDARRRAAANGRRQSI